MRALLGLVLLAIAPGRALAEAKVLTAIVEAIEAGRPAVEELEPLEAGRVVTLRAGERIVLGYFDSCAREIVAGPGEVRVGDTVSRLEGASLVDRRTIDCKGVPTAGIEPGNGAALRLRGLGDELPEPTAGTLLHLLGAMRDARTTGLSPSREPVLLLADPATAVSLEPLDRQGRARRLRAEGALVDLRGATDPLEPGRWRARRGTRQLTFTVPPQAGVAAAGRAARLVRF